MAEDRDLLLRRVKQAQKPPTWALSQSPRGGNDSRDENKGGSGHRSKLRRPSHRHGNGEAPPSWGEDEVRRRLLPHRPSGSFQGSGKTRDRVAQNPDCLRF